jgi:hypothetical protein
VTIIIIIAPIRCCMHQRSCVIVKKKTFLFLFLYTALDVIRAVHIIITFLFSSPFLSLIICARPSLICIYKDLPPYFSSHNSYPELLYMFGKSFGAGVHEDFAVEKNK